MMSSAGRREAFASTCIQVFVEAAAERRRYAGMQVHRWRGWHRAAVALLVAAIGWAAAAQLAQGDGARRDIGSDSDPLSGNGQSSAQANAREADRLRDTFARELARITSREIAEASQAEFVADASLGDDDLVGLLGRLATDAMLHVERFKPGGSESDADGAQRNMAIELSGSYFALADWIGNLGLAGRPIGIDALHIERVTGGGGVHARADLKVLGMRTGMQTVTDAVTTSRRRLMFRGDTGPEPGFELADPFLPDMLVTPHVVGRLRGAGRVVEVALRARAPGTPGIAGKRSLRTPDNEEQLDSSREQAQVSPASRAKRTSQATQASQAASQGLPVSQTPRTAQAATETGNAQPARRAIEGADPTDTDSVNETSPDPVDPEVNAS